MIFYRAGAVTGVADTYSIEKFNTKAMVVDFLYQRQDWKVPEIKNSNLVIPERYTFMASNSLFIVLGSWPIQNIRRYIVSSNVIITTLQANH